jgi:hypothetical protein
LAGENIITGIIHTSIPIQAIPERENNPSGRTGRKFQKRVASAENNGLTLMNSEKAKFAPQVSEDPERDAIRGLRAPR